MFVNSLDFIQISEEIVKYKFTEV